MVLEAGCPPRRPLLSLGAVELCKMLKNMIPLLGVAIRATVLGAAGTRRWLAHRRPRPWHDVQCDVM
jgi:hypothetical protein